MRNREDGNMMAKCEIPRDKYTAYSRRLRIPTIVFINDVNVDMASKLNIISDCGKRRRSFL